MPDFADKSRGSHWYGGICYFELKKATVFSYQGVKTRVESVLVELNLDDSAFIVGKLHMVSDLHTIIRVSPFHFRVVRHESQEAGLHNADVRFDVAIER